MQFSEKICYSGDYTGNITYTWYDYSIGETPKLYNLDYTYDGISRLLSVVDVVNPTSLYNEAFSYDQVGRIKQKRRGESTLAGFTQQYVYKPLTNKLDYVSGKQALNNYAYNALGSMTEDKSKKMDTVLYDWRDMPVQFVLKETAETWQSAVDMIYDAAGNRVLKKENVTKDGVTESAKAVAYINEDMVYENDNYQTLPYSLKYFNIGEEGRMDYPSLTSYY
jgi:hypothetical protein